MPIDYDGYSIFVGKNNIQNDYLTFKFADKNDYWFHVQSLHGSHVILKLNGKELTDDIIFKCATLAKENSKAKNDSKVCVDYTTLKFVKRSPSLKPGMVNYINYKSIIV